MTLAPENTTFQNGLPGTKIRIKLHMARALEKINSDPPLIEKSEGVNKAYKVSDKTTAVAINAAKRTDRGS
jgi:hypothetical protein